MATKKIRNVVLLASTGNGKSSTGNTLLGEDFFIVGEEMGSCTIGSSEKVNPKLGINVIDTAGFGDNRFDQHRIDLVLRELTGKIIRFDDQGTNKIDAFVLVTKCTPRASCLKADIDHICNIFGAVALKSLIIFVIAPTKYCDNHVRRSLEEMEYVVNVIGEARGQDFNDNWYVRWDNINPRPNQMQQFMERLDCVEGYTHEKFIAAQEDIKKRLNKLVEERMVIEREKLQKRYAEDKAKLDEQLAKMHQKFEAERQELIAKSNEAAAFAKKTIDELRESMQEEQEENKANLAKLQSQLQNAYNQKLKEIESKKSEEYAELKKEMDLQLAQLQAKLLQNLTNQQCKGNGWGSIFGTLAGSLLGGKIGNLFSGFGCRSKC